MPRIAPFSQLFRSLLLSSPAVAALFSPAHGFAQTREVPLPIEQALATIEVAPGYKVELAACEPAVIDPVAIRFDEKGRMWVAEMRDYPLGPAPGMPGMSTIRLVEDRNNDGLFETSTLFADNLLFVTGLQPWKEGLIVTVSGKLLYLKDTDADGKADLQETWFEGFSETNSQLRANHPTLAPDGFVYVAGGLRGGMIVDRRPSASSQEPINISGMDFRFDPNGGKAEAVSGAGQFGLTFDDYGNRFVCSNRNPCQQVIFENSDLRRVPSIAVPAVMQDVARSGEQSRIYAISKAWTTSNLHAGQFTAACGVMIYRDQRLADLRRNVLTCDPTGNLVHLERIDWRGATFVSKPAYKDSEFLRSSDDWFRPVSMQVGPDGALYVVDMCRAVIEHPEWVPDELKKRPDERYGDQHGRIWRIVPTNDAEYRKFEPLSSPMAGLISPSIWQRELATRLLLEKSLSSEDAAALQKLLADPTQPVTGRHLAARLLNAKGQLSETNILAMLADKEAPLRQLALRMFSCIPVEKRSEQLVAAAVKRLDDERFSVIFTAMIAVADTPKEQLSYMYSNWKRKRLVKKLVEYAISAFHHRIRHDPNIETAALMLASEAPEEWLEAMISQRRDATQVFSTSYVKSIAEQAGSKCSPDSLQKQLSVLLEKTQLSHGFVASALSGMGQGLARQGKTLEDVAGNNFALMRLLQAKRNEAVSLAGQADANDSDRILAIELIGALPDASDTLVLLAQKEDGPLPVRQRAIATLARQADLEPWKELLASFSSQSPPLRQSILDGVLSNAARTGLLLDLMQAGQIKPTELDVTQQNRLLATSDAEMRKRATAILGSSIGEDRKKALADYQPVLAMTGDARKGQAVFAKNCSACHKIGSVGVNVAPDISDSRTKTPAQLLGDILQPNRAIDANYIAYTLVTTDGITASGILTTETSTSITLKMQNEKVMTVPRSEIEILKSTGVSLMPEGLERNIPPAEMADLIAFIKNWRYLTGEIPGLGK